MSTLFVWRSGEMGVGARERRGTIPIAIGPREALRKLIAVRGRLAYDNKTWLLPGIPEANSEAEALAAVDRFIHWCDKRPVEGTSLVRFVGANKAATVGDAA